MGNYPGKLSSQVPAPTQEVRDLRERPKRRAPTRTSQTSQTAAHSLRRPHHNRPALPPRRPSYRVCGTLPYRFVITPQRQYPIQQAQYSLPGVLPTVCWNGYHKKTVLSARNSRMVGSQATVRIPPPDSRLTRSLLPELMVSSERPSPSSNALDPCAKETVPSTLKEKNERSVEEEEQMFNDVQGNQRRCSDGVGSGHLVLEPVMTSGVPAAFVPTSGFLKRDLNSQSPDDRLNKRPCTSPRSSRESTYTSGIPSSSRNAITSSYSSSSSSLFSSPASSHFQVPERPAKKTRGEISHPSSSSALLVTEKASWGENKVAETATCEKLNAQNSPSTPGSSRQRKRKVRLLPSRRGGQLTLPPPPQLGYTITAEDLDLEKEASLRWLNKVLEDKTDPALSFVTENTHTTTQPFTPPATGTASSPYSLPTPSTNPPSESLQRMHNSPGLPSFMAVTPEHTPLKSPGFPASLVSSQSAPLPSTSLDSTVTFLGQTPASCIIPVTDTTKSLLTPQAETSIKSQTLTAQSPHPKGRFPTTSAIAGVSPASPVTNTIFEIPPKSENEDPLPSRPSEVTTTSSSNSVFPMTHSASPLTSKPVFDPSMGLLNSVTSSAPFFSQTVTPATTTSTPLFSGQAGASAPVVSIATASICTDFAPKHAFAFSMSNMTDTISSETCTTTSQPFHFGTPSASGASFVPSLDSTVQFGKPPAIPASTAVTAFGQCLPSASQTSDSSSTAHLSGTGSTLTVSAPVTTSQSALTSTTTPAFSIPVGSSTKPALPSLPGTSPQPTFGAPAGQQQGALSFSSSFTFGNSAAPTPTATPAPAFGSAPAVFSIGAAPTSEFGATPQTSISEAGSSSLFSNTKSSPFTFGGSAAPTASGAFGIKLANSGTSSTSGASCFGTGQNGTSGNTTSFGGGFSQSTWGAPSQSTPSAINVVSTPEKKPVFGGTSAPTFGQDTPAPGMGTLDNSLYFGASSTPSQGFAGVGSFNSATPSFSVGAGSKTPRTRQQLQARRQHTRKK
ncbi:Nuclear envelope pore membrane protein POM 121C [Galemys pyrenaicus]|uniref:Nuclear envelope pore membrane protein POM 121C n=1 Tax=Galemys pyrenaicus TaxID=202257 RepID=A0A8J6DUD2_GALPY|nr:Nuclear envelope pore membrane protein POM 121C [Galemys pyrenaicus]